MEKLDILSNDIGEKGIKAVVEALTKNSSLKTLDIVSTFSDPDEYLMAASKRGKEAAATAPGANSSSSSSEEEGAAHVEEETI